MAECDPGANPFVARVFHDCLYKCAGFPMLCFAALTSVLRACSLLYDVSSVWVVYSADCITYARETAPGIWLASVLECQGMRYG